MLMLSRHNNEPAVWPHTRKLWRKSPTELSSMCWSHSTKSNRHSSRTTGTTSKYDYDVVAAATQTRMPPRVPSTWKIISLPLPATLLLVEQRVLKSDRKLGVRLSCPRRKTQ